MYILGISCYYHDAAAVLLKDGMLVAAAEEERFTRKHRLVFPSRPSDFAWKKPHPGRISTTSCFLRNHSASSTASS